MDTKKPGSFWKKNLQKSRFLVGASTLQIRREKHYILIIGNGAPFLQAVLSNNKHELKKEELLYMVAYNEMKAGFIPYLMFGRFNGDTLE